MLNNGFVKYLINRIDVIEQLPIARMKYWSIYNMFYAIVIIHFEVLNFDRWTKS